VYGGWRCARVEKEKGKGKKDRATIAMMTEEKVLQGPHVQQGEGAPSAITRQRVPLIDGAAT
jgi:hypothetical protein